MKDTRDGRDGDASAAADVQTAEVVLPKEMARRLSDRIGSPLTGTPPAPMQWDRDQLALLGLTDPQIDALNAATTRAGEAALAEMKRVIRPLSAEEYSKIPDVLNIERNRSGQAEQDLQRFIVPDWHLALAAGRAGLNSEILSIAGPQRDPLHRRSGSRGTPVRHHRVLLGDRGKYTDSLLREPCRRELDNSRRGAFRPGQHIQYHFSR